MNWLAPLLDIFNKIMDKLPSRKEALLNEIEDTKQKIKLLQQKQDTWTSVDSGNYYALDSRLSQLTKRAANL